MKPEQLERYEALGRQIKELNQQAEEIAFMVGFKKGYAHGRGWLHGDVKKLWEQYRLDSEADAAKGAIDEA